MRFEWARAFVMAGVLALAACGRGGDAGAAGADAAENLKAAEAFLEQNAKADGVIVLPSGVQYKVVAPGPANGAAPDSNDLVRVDYEGSLIDGSVFDSSYKRGAPAVFQLDQVVPGWTDALQHMKVGDEWLVYIPPELGYRDTGRPGIPPNSVLTFRLKLLDVAPTPGGARGISEAMG